MLLVGAVHLCGDLRNGKDAGVYVHFKGFVYKCAWTVAHQVSKGGAMIDGAGYVCVDATAFRKSDIEHVKVSARGEGLYASEVSLYEVYGRVG